MVVPVVISTLEPHASGVEPDSRYGWDWSATTHDARGSGLSTKAVTVGLLHVLGPTHIAPGKGLQGWSESVQAFDHEGFKLATVYYGGDRTDVHVVSTSDAADRVRPRVAPIKGAKTSRVDTRVDTLLSFDTLEELCRDVAGPRTKVLYYEGSVGGESTGRTLYVGAPSSDLRVRVYEKWLEAPGQYEEGTNRVEVQLRPPSRGKEAVSSWAPGETFCATKLTRRLADALGEYVYSPGSLQKSKGTPDLQRTIKAMGDQYGKAAREWVSLSGGDVGTLLDYLEL